MSRILSVSVQLIRPSFLDVIKIMTESSWVIRDVNGISYLPEDAEDAADWKMFSTDSAEQVLEVCGQRESEGRVAGLVLLLKNTDSGGSFVWSVEGTLLVSLSVNVSNPWDLNRWVETILRPLSENGGVESFSFGYY